MRRISLVLLACAGLVFLGPFAGALWAEKPADVDKINKKIDSFTLKDDAGKPVSLASLEDRKAVVLVFLSFDCPVSCSYSPTLAALHKTWSDKGVAFLGVDAGDDLTAGQIAKKAKEFGIPFPVLKDDHFKAADLLKAKISPEAFVLDHNRVLRYRGRIDNSYWARLKKNRKTTQHDLQDALADVLAGKSPRTPATIAIGCPIARGETPRTAGKVAYHRDVLPILQKHCQQCHRAGEVGPFALTTYKQAANWSSDIKEYTRDRKMPPWKPVEGVSFHNERKLTDKELQTLAAWADDGAPEGDAKDAPRPPVFTDGWQLGKPDLVLTVPADMTVGASGKDLFRCFVLPTGLTEDKHVVAVEVRPGNKSIVHHSLNFFDLSGKGREMEKAEKERQNKNPDLKDRGPGYSAAMGVGFTPDRDKFGGVGGWAPGQRARLLPEGYGHPLPKGSDFILQLHYHRNGREETDRTRVGLYFAHKPGVKPYKSVIVRGNFLFIPAGKATFRVKGSTEVLQDCEVHSIMPHMHMLGKEIKVTMTPPGGETTTLLAIKNWDYNWQETYFLTQPIAVKKGTKFGVEAVYDNSDKNSNNPFHPQQWVRFGEQTDNEMCFVFLGAVNDASRRPIPFKVDGFTQPKPAENKP